MSGIRIVQVIWLCAWVTNGHVGRHIDVFDGVYVGVWCRSEEFGKKNVIRVLSGGKIMCVNYMV